MLMMLLMMIKSPVPGLLKTGLERSHVFNLVLHNVDKQDSLIHIPNRPSPFTRQGAKLMRRNSVGFFLPV
ncbi:hypothetical protein F2Q69_00056947 [Brassica cretica]|uniref:Uncharacterized protein n=1 Tax=Brassica cretica TaxID=69181 RepID=A0A8S9MRG1_BRACR|nr:hypothetical protein F2Q69_00056947 [Brassica cretica]